MSTTVLHGGAVHTGSRMLDPGWLLMAEGVVTAVGLGVAPVADRAVDTTGQRVVPGFIDLHCHGGAGVSFDGPAPTRAEDAARVVGVHRDHGTTTLVASLVSAPVEDMEATVRALADVVAEGLLAGVHLEGPWLSPSRAGAHDPAHLRDPEPHDVDRLLRSAPGAVVVVTLAAELPGGLDAVRRVVDHGAVAALGHTGADTDAAKAAIEAGVRLGTHLFNAMPPVHHRAPGPAVVLLEDERVAVELVADGVHLHPLILAHAARTAGPNRTVLVTDAMAAAGAGDGSYRLGASEVQVHHSVARLAGTDVVAGSTLTLDRALRHAVIEAGVSFVDALAAVTSTPAAVLGRADVGTLEPGARADLVLLDAELNVRGVWVRGCHTCPAA